MKVESSKNGNVSEFIFNDISSENLGCIVTVAMKNYGVSVLFADCSEKDKSKVFNL